MLTQKKKHKEISIEKRKSNDSLVKATIVTKYTTGEKVKEEVQIIEGTPGEVNAQFDTFKKQVLQEREKQSMLSIKKCRRRKWLKKYNLISIPKVEVCKRDGYVY